MEKTPRYTQRLYRAGLAVITWLALILQLYLLIVLAAEKGKTAWVAVSEFFRYFTTLTNLLVAVCLTAVWWQPASRWGRFFNGPETVAAVAVYITVVGLVYNIVLRPSWSPTGWSMVADELLHSVIPVLFVLYWLLYIPKGRLSWKATFPWLLYPLIYIVYVGFFGMLTGFYPYPFIDVTQIGYPHALMNTVFLCGVFLVLGWIFIAIDRLMRKPGRQ